MALAPGLSRKLKKVLESRTETPDLLASLKTLSTFYEENTPHARRNLRSTIEKRALSINLDFLQASSTAQQVTLSLSPPYILFSLYFSLSFCFSRICFFNDSRLWIKLKRRLIRSLNAVTGFFLIIRI